MQMESRYLSVAWHLYVKTWPRRGQLLPDIELPSNVPPYDQGTDIPSLSSAESRASSGGPHVLSAPPILLPEKITQEHNGFEEQNEDAEEPLMFEGSSGAGFRMQSPVPLNFCSLPEDSSSSHFLFYSHWLV